MTTRHLFAALAALSLALAPDLAPAEPKVRIRDDQYSGLISGASFVSNYVSVTGHYVELDPPEWYSDEDYPDDETQVPEGWPTNWVEILENWRWGEYVYATNYVAGPWASSNETWTADGGFSPHYWPSTNGIVRLGPDGIRALYGRDELYYIHPRVWDAMYAWRSTSQPAAYGSVSDNKYVNLYGGRHADDTGLGVVAVDTVSGAKVVCNMARDGAPVQVDDVVYFDGMVAFEPFMTGEGNRPDDILTADAKVAMYMQDRPNSDVPYLYVVARDWVTGEVRHYPVGDEYYRPSLEARTEHDGSTFYCGRVTICLMRTIYGDTGDPTVPGIAVFVGGAPVYHYENPYQTPPPSTLTWGHVRSDLGFTVDASHVDHFQYGSRDWDGHLLVFRPLDAGGASLALSGMSYGGTLRLGAYAVSRANPLNTVYFCPEWAVDVAQPNSWFELAASATGYSVHRDQPQARGWRGANGWADESYNHIEAGRGCSVTLDESCFRHGRAYLDSADGLTDEDWAALEAGGLPHVPGRTGPFYINVRDALTHAVYLGGTVSVIADPESILDIVVTGLVQDVELDAANRTVATNVTIAGAGPDAGFSLTSCRIDGTVRATGVATRVDGTVYGGRIVLDGVPVANLMANITPVVKPDGVNYVSDLPEGTIPDEARYALLATNSRTRINRGRIVGDMYVVGGHPSTTAGDPDFEIRGGSMTGRIVLDNVPFATIGGCSMYSDIDYAGLPRPHRSESLMTTNVNITINDGYYRGEMHVTGGSLRVTGGDFAPGITARGASAVDITGGSGTLQLYDCTIDTLRGFDDVTVSNSASALDLSGHLGPYRLTDVGDVAITGERSKISGNLYVTRAKSLTITRGNSADYPYWGKSGLPVFYPLIEGDIYAWDTPVAIYGGAGDAWRPETGSRLEVYGGPVLLDGAAIGIYSMWDFPASPGVVVISNSPSVVVESGYFYSSGKDIHSNKPMHNGRFTVYDSPLTVHGGDFHVLDVRNATGDVDISGSPRVWGDASFTAPSVVIGGGTFAPDPYPDGEWAPPTLNITATGGASITNGTFNVHIAGSGISVSGGRFLWYPNQRLDSDGTISLAPGKKLVMVGSGGIDLTSKRNTYWEVRNQ